MAEIYITYRRIDSSDISGRIYDRLVVEFGRDAIFRDVETLGPAEDFGERMFEETIQCKVLIVVIGSQWLDAQDRLGNRKIDNPNDWIHREILAFLKRPESRIFPLLVHDASMPAEYELPAPLADFAGRFAIEIRGGREFHQDMTGLVNSIRKYITPKLNNRNNDPKKVFIVHGHDTGLLAQTARFVENQKLKPIILSERPNLGRTIIEKFEEETKEIDYAIVLLTPDDLAFPKGQENKERERARQNVIFELGYFAKMLGRDGVCLLYKGNIEIPSDLYGIVYIPADSADWQFQLGKEMKAFGLPIDLNII